MSRDRVKSFVSSDLSTECTQYRTVSFLAVATFVVGIACALAHAHMVLWSLPFVAVAMGVMALRRIAANDWLTGSRWAATGIVCACFFGSWAIVRAVTTARILEHEALAYTNTLMELVRHGDTLLLHQQSLNPLHRSNDPVSLQNLYRDSEELRESMDKFTAQEPWNTALQLASHFRWNVSGTIDQPPGGNVRVVNLPIHVSSTRADRPWDQETILALQRGGSGSQKPWRVLGWQVRTTP
ncbi:MAG: DUF4190 domain-containing protein [Planctomycetota bacterium]|nr:DUF4190 domain-containing protein [Planctomycetota bacterium]